MSSPILRNKTMEPLALLAGVTGRRARESRRAKCCVRSHSLIVDTIKVMLRGCERFTPAASLRSPRAPHYVRNAIDGIHSTVRRQLDPSKGGS
jgi:hypothetical protein